MVNVAAMMVPIIVLLGQKSKKQQKAIAKQNELQEPKKSKLQD